MVGKLNQGGATAFWVKKEQQKKVGSMDSAETDMAKTEARFKYLRKINATVIPAPRKSVKRMMFEAIVDSIAGFFSSQGNRPDNIDNCCSEKKPMVRAPCSRKTKRICPY